MHISQRTLHIPTSPIRKLAPIANRVEKTKKNLSPEHRTAGYPHSGKLFQGVASYHPKVVAYGKSQGGCQTAGRHPEVLCRMGHGLCHR